METHVIDLSDLQELVRGNPIACGPVWVVLDVEQLLTALGALKPLSLQDPGHTAAGVELLKAVGIDLDAHADPLADTYTEPDEEPT